MKTERFFLLTTLVLLVFLLNSQVGINTNDPNQTLDVNGKIAIGNDGASPTEGTIRYNTTENDFEGYNGTNWNSFTAQSGRFLPQGAYPIYGTRFVDVDASPSTYFNMSLYDMRNNSPLGTTVPAGKSLIVTDVWVTFSGGFSAPINRYVAAQVRTASNHSILFQGYHNSGLMPSRHASMAPLLIQSAGNSVQCRGFQYGGSGNYYDSYTFEIRGFIVDDLNWD